MSLLLLFNVVTTINESFKHKGLKKFFVKGDLSGIQANHAERLRDRLAFLNVAVCIEDMRKPGYRLHELTGDLKGRWSIAYQVTGE